MTDIGLGGCFQIIFFAVCCAYWKIQLLADRPSRETEASQATGERKPRRCTGGAAHSACSRGEGEAWAFPALPEIMD